MAKRFGENRFGKGVPWVWGGRKRGRPWAGLPKQPQASKTPEGNSSPVDGLNLPPVSSFGLLCNPPGSCHWGERGGGSWAPWEVPRLFSGSCRCEPLLCLCGDLTVVLLAPLTPGGRVEAPAGPGLQPPQQVLKWHGAQLEQPAIGPDGRAGPAVLHPCQNRHVSLSALLGKEKGERGAQAWVGRCGRSPLPPELCCATPEEPPLRNLVSSLSYVDPRGMKGNLRLEPVHL